MHVMLHTAHISDCLAHKDQQEISLVHFSRDGLWSFKFLAGICWYKY